MSRLETLEVTWAAGINTDSGYDRIMDPDMGPDVTMASGDSAGHSDQFVPPISSAQPLDISMVPSSSLD